MANKSNISPLIADVREFLNGSDQAEGGRAALSLHLVAYLATPFVHRYTVKDGTEYTDSFTVRDLVMDKPRNEDGSFASNVQGHRRETALVELFQFDKWNIPQRMQAALDKIVPEAIAVHHYFGRNDGTISLRMERVPGSLGKSSRRVIGGIAAGDMFELLDKEGKPTALARKSMKAMLPIFRAHKKRDARDDGELLEFMLAYEVPADGCRSSLFGDAKALTSSQFLKTLVERAIGDGVLPAPPKRDRERGDKGSSFAADAASVLAVLDGVLATDESPVAFDAKIEEVMDRVCQKWAAYRAAFLPL